MTIIARQFVLAARPTGRPQLTDFRLEEATIPDPASGEVVLQVQYLSLDPYMRGRMDDRKSYVPPVKLGGVMSGENIATVIASKNADFAVGDIVSSQTGWCTHALSNGQNLRKLDPRQTPITTALGILGMPGFTAYSGLFLIGKPKAGETVCVAAASGPVGSLVGQLAKIVGARAVGIAGGSQKCDYLRSELGFDAAIDHRAADFPAQLAAACPKGIDVYFENVGGAVWQAVLPLLNKFARVPVCGLIAQYNATSFSNTTDHLPGTMREILTKSLLLRGYINYEFAEHIPKFRDEVSNWIAEGKVRYREDIVDGFENTPQAFIGLLEGQNFGKLIIRVDKNAA